MIACDKGTFIDAIWAFISLSLGEVFSFTAVLPALYGANLVARYILTINFGFLLGAMFFLVGLPIIGVVTRMVQYFMGRFRGTRPSRSKKP